MQMETSSSYIPSDSVFGMHKLDECFILSKYTIYSCFCLMCGFCWDGQIGAYVVLRENNIRFRQQKDSTKELELTLYPTVTINFNPLPTSDYYL